MESTGLICSVCHKENELASQLCNRCGAQIDRNLPPLLVLESLFTRDLVWGINAAGFALPLGLLSGGFLVAWIIWAGQGFYSAWGLGAFASLAMGTVVTLAILPMFRRVQSLLFGVGVLTLSGLAVMAVGGLVLGFYLFIQVI